MRRLLPLLFAGAVLGVPPVSGVQAAGDTLNFGPGSMPKTQLHNEIKNWKTLIQAKAIEAQ